MRFSFAMRFLALLTAGLAALLLTAVSDAASEPRLSLVDRTPVVLAGTGFAAGTRVVVTVRTPSRVLTQPLRVGSTGGFRLRLPTLRLTGRLRCAAGVTIVVRPSGGVPILWRAPRLQDCASPPPAPA
jgi:hypothetical protein